MARRSTASFDTGFFLQLSLGLFFLSLGIMGLGDYNSRMSEFARFLGRDDSLRVLIAVVELVMGGLLLLGLFFPVSPALARLFAIALFALWAFYLLYSYFLNGIFEPDFIPWLYEVAWRSVILAALGAVGRKYLA